MNYGTDKEIKNFTLNNEVSENKYVSLWKEGNILCAKYKDEVIIGLEAAKEIVIFRRKFFPGKHLSLIYMNKLGGINAEARKYFASAEPNRDLLKGAFVVKNQFLSFFLNAFIKVNKPLVPIKIFSKKTEAMEWLLKKNNY